VLDLLGVLDQRASFPFAERLAGRSLLRYPPPSEPRMLMSTGSGVWEPDELKVGAMQGDLLAVKAAGGDWWCFDVRADPGETVARSSLPGCAELVDLGRRSFHVE
jgi:hypothetical protein